MGAPTWLKNLLLVSVTLGLLLLLTAGLIQRPNLEEPPGWEQAAVALQPAVARVNRAFAEDWQQAELEPAPEADWMTVVRRLSLGLAGTIPSLEEIRRLEQLPEAERIDWWIAYLLRDQRTGDFLAERWARAMVGVEDGPFLVYRRRRFTNWLAQQLMSNRPYDDLVRAVLTEEGIWTDTPSVNFYTRTISEDNEQRPDPILLAGRTSRVFLGMRIDCLQCHDDFLGTIDLGSPSQPTGGTQLDFHSLAAFFAETQNSILGIRDNPESPPYEVELLDREGPTAIEPAFPFLPELDPGPPATSGEGSQRQRMAQWVTHPDNRPFARAAVNRMWAIMTGQGLVQPVDDIPLAGPFPPALEALVDDFVAHGFDLQRLIRVIAASDGFCRSSTADFAITAAHQQHHAVFPLTRLRPDQVSGAIAQSTQLATIDATAHIVTRLTQFGQQNDFVRRFGDPGEDEFNDRGETVTQRLLMLNGNMIAERLDNGLNSPSHVAGLAPDSQTAVDVAYLTTLTRYPTAAERDEMESALSPLTGKQRSAEVVDIYWSLINSAEFRWNH